VVVIDLAVRCVGTGSAEVNEGDDEEDDDDVKARTHAERFATGADDAMTRHRCGRQ